MYSFLVKKELIIQQSLRSLTNFTLMKTKTIILLTALSIAFLACKSELKPKPETEVQGWTTIETPKVGEGKEIVANAKKALPVKVLNFDELSPLLSKKDDKIHVINFWATWCKPCVEELPAFEKLHKEYQDKNVELLLVSLDFPNQIESELVPFMEKNKLAPEVVVLDDPNQNKWINGVDKTWTGAIPATLIYHKDKRAFFEQSFDYNTLTKEVQKFINP